MIERAVNLGSETLKSEYVIGDVAEILNSGFQPDTFDMIYADPPYKVGMNIIGDEKKRDLRGYFLWLIDTLYIAVRTLKRRGHLYISFSAQYLHYLRMLIDRPDWFASDKVWNFDMGDYHKLIYLNNALTLRNVMIVHNTDRHKPYPLGEANYNYDYEPMLYYTKFKAKPLNRKTGFLYDTVIETKIEKVRTHPTQKPLLLYEHLVKFSTKKGDTILDMFTGSGNLLHMAHALSRRSIGIDIDDQYLDGWCHPDSYDRVVRFLATGQQVLG